MDSMLSAYLLRVERKRGALTTYQGAERILTRYDRWLQGQGLRAASVTPSQCEDYFEHLLGVYAVSTAGQHLIQIRAAYSYALRRGEVRLDPTVDVFLPRTADREPRVLSMDELRAIHAAILTSRDELAFYLLAYTGMRRAEVAGLAWADVDFEGQTLTVMGKGSKLRKVACHPDLAVVLKNGYDDRGDERYVIEGQNGRMTPNGFGDVVVRPLLERAGVDATGHAFRKTVATLLEEAEVREAIIEDLLGWSKRSVRGRHYTRVSPARHHEAIRKLYALDPIVLPASLVAV